MNSEPCVRFGIRISPKISEKPADNRNSSPPKVTLLTASTSQKFMAEMFLAGDARCGLSQEMQRTLFPSALVGEGSSRRRQVYAVCASLTARDSEHERGEGLFC